MTLDELCATATIRDAGYHRFPAPYQQMSVTLEEAQLLYALVRAIRPRNVLELGTGLGLSGFFIASALKANGDDGFLFTVEPNADFALAAAQLLFNLPAAVIRSANLGDPHLVYIDSAQSQRAAHIEMWLDGSYRGLVLVHDAERQYPEIEAGVGVYLPTANGMWLGRSKEAT
jgi:predicted O-methyltransferase YrrM